MTIIKHDQPYRVRVAEGGLRAGAIVYKLTRSDYGCANDDTRHTGIQHISVTLNKDGDWPSTSVRCSNLSEVPYKPHLFLHRPGVWGCGSKAREYCWPVALGTTPKEALKRWHGKVLGVHT